MSPKWDDLATRIFTAVLLAVVGLAAIFLGGFWLKSLASVLGAIMMWELVRLVAPTHRKAAIVLPLLSFAALFLSGATMFTVGQLLLPVLVGTIWLGSHNKDFIYYSPVIMFGAYGAFAIQVNAGLDLIILVIAVVIITDIAGYFVGRFVGGPKFWPRYSPKKTWSGTAGGWFGAAAVGAYLASPGYELQVAVACVALALASQLGDIWESAIKRRAGVKDSSNLLPGHGGFMDRLDGMIVAFTLALVFSFLLGAFPGNL